MIPLRPCLVCGLRTRTTAPRCGPHEREYQRRRNTNPRRQALYGGAYPTQRRQALANATLCPRCGVDLIRSRTARNGATWDHEHGQVECRSCNSSHRRDAT